MKAFKSQKQVLHSQPFLLFLFIRIRKMHGK